MAGFSFRVSGRFSDETGRKRKTDFTKMKDPFVKSADFKRIVQYKQHDETMAFVLADKTGEALR